MQGNLHVDGVPGGFGPAVHGEMLGSGDGSKILGIVALHPGDECHGHAAGEEGILAISLLAAAPAWIAENIDVRRPKIEAKRAAEPGRGTAGLLLLQFMEPGPRLGTDGNRHLVDSRCVEGGAQSDYLREHRSVIGYDAVQGLSPPVVGGNLETRDGSRCIHHLAGLFLHGHAGDQVVNALVNLMATAISWIRAASKVGPNPITCGNTVALLVTMPCRASVHQL